MNFKLFSKILDNIKRRQDEENKINYLFQTICSDFILTNTDKEDNLLLEILSNSFPNHYLKPEQLEEILFSFIWELDFGKRWNEKLLLSVNLPKDIDFNSYESLYNFLTT